MMFLAATNIIARQRPERRPLVPKMLTWIIVLQCKMCDKAQILSRTESATLQHGGGRIAAAIREIQGTFTFFSMLLWDSLSN